MVIKFLIFGKKLDDPLIMSIIIKVILVKVDK